MMVSARAGICGGDVDFRRSSARGGKASSGMRSDTVGAEADETVDDWRHGVERCEDGGNMFSARLSVAGCLFAFGLTLSLGKSERRKRRQ